MTYQPSWIIQCHIHPPRRTVGYHLTHNWKDKGFIPYPYIITRREFEFAYYDFSVQRFNHYTRRTPLWERYEFPYLHNYWLNDTTTVLLQALLWHWTTPEGWYTNKQTNQTKSYSGLVSWRCRIQWRHLCREVRIPHPLNECPAYDTKQSGGEAPVMLEHWETRSTPSLPSLPGPLWSGVVAPKRVLSIG